MARLLGASADGIISDEFEVLKSLVADRGKVVPSRVLPVILFGHGGDSLVDTGGVAFTVRLCVAARRCQGRSSSLRCGRSTLTAPTSATFLATMKATPDHGR